MRILLTGAGGMVGRNILEHPDAAAHVMLTPPRSELDLRRFADVRDYVIRHRPDLVIHAAGKVGGIHANVRDPVAFLVDNLDMGRNVVLAAHGAGVRRLLNLGSSCMYPRGHDTPLREDMVLTGALEPTNEGYALGKIVTARLCEYLNRQDPSVAYKTMIPCNLYGRHDSFEAERSHLIPAIIRKMYLARASHAASVEIWGDGSARREFMYAGDLAEAIFRVVNDFAAVPPVMNVGLGHDFSVDEYYRTAAAVIGYTGSFRYDLDKPVGMARKLVDVGRLRAWGWRPAHSLEQGVRRTCAFYEEATYR